MKIIRHPSRCRSTQKWIALITLLLVTLLTGCARKQDPTRTPSPPSAARATAPVSTDTSATVTPNATGLPNVGSLFEPTAPPQVYIVKGGDTLSAIAARFGCDMQELAKANDITDPNALQVGQQLDIPSTTMDVGPAIQLLPNSEFVNGPAYIDFDIGAFCARQGGYLFDYQEMVNGQLLSGPEIITLVAHELSLGPRLLLALVELESGAVTGSNPTGSLYSYAALSQAANRLNEGYYDWRGRGVTFITWGDGTITRYAPTLNAATAGLQYYFARGYSRADWEVLVGDGPGSFIETYRQLFGDPAQYAVEPLISADTEAPTFVLPWPKGDLWYFTGGPHGGWGEGSAWCALDFVPDEGYLGCQAASSFATAAAPGLVIHSQDGEVMVDLDGDGHEQTGWVLFYLHVASQDRVPVGTYVKQGDPIGHPSCEGGAAEVSHLHIARKYNGEWIAADGPLPFVMSGWQFHSSGTSYDGTATRAGEERSSCECWTPDFNGLVADR
jgi:LasA protease